MVVFDSDVVAFCLTLRGSARQADVKREFERVGADGWVEYVETERDIEDGMRGCFVAHQLALRKALARDPRPSVIFVFEDDVVFHMRGGWTLEAAVEAAVDTIRQGKADILSLGAIPLFPMREHLRPGVRAVRWNYTHAIAVSYNAASTIVATAYRGIHYDRYLTDFRQALVVPTIAFQKPYWTQGEVTTTDTHSPIYRILVFLRNLASPRYCQIAIEWLSWSAGVFWNDNKRV